MEDAGEGEAAEARTDDRDGCRHGRFLSRSIGTLFHDQSWNNVPTVSRWCHGDARRERTERRTDALSKERIVEAAIEILDADGESALTFRALAAAWPRERARSTGTSPTRTSCSRRPPTTSSPAS